MTEETTYQRADFYSRSETAKALGVSVDTVTRLKLDGTLPLGTTVGKKDYYRKADVERIKREVFPPGLTYRQIADMYGLSVNTIKKNFAQRNVKPHGRHRSHQSVVFDPDTVAKVARSLGWLRSHSNEASTPAAEAIAIGALS